MQDKVGINQVNAMEEGFEKGQSDNLPKIDGFMVADYFSRNSNFVAAEMRGVKMQRSGRESYGDDAIGYVQVKRTAYICKVKCRITPEHRVRSKPYHCSLKCDEKEKTIVNVLCDDCAASAGGCKHAVAFLMWLHRRSEEPSTTSIKCYWKKAKLSGIGTTLKIIKAKDFGTGHTVESNDGIFLDKIIPKLRECQAQCSLLKYVSEKTEVEKISMHYLINTFKNANTSRALRDVNKFVRFCSNEMTESKCMQIKEATKVQSESNLWFEMRYGRITASKMHEVAQCKTKDGSLVEEIFGAAKFKESAAIKRGKSLESEVKNVVSRLKNIKITESGLFLNSKWPMIGASPDGLTTDSVIEIKCPYKAHTFRLYYDNGKLGKQFYAQIQAQMHMSGRKKGLFCIAHVDFETSEMVDVHEVSYDEKYCEILFDKCVLFWKNNIFDKLIK